MSVNVYFPFGVPINIKFTQDTPILQILKEACGKQNLNPSEYDLKYHNKTLDVNMTIRYARIANNGKLDVVKRNIPRAVSNVRICVQLENRERKNGEFSPDVNIQKVLSDLKVEYDAETAVIIFTQKEIYSKDFETVTLLSLGLGAGSALLRLFHRDPERPREQAHVYVPPTPKVSIIEDDRGRTESAVGDDKDREPSVAKPLKNHAFDPICAIRAEKMVPPKESPEQAKKVEPSQSENEKNAIEHTRLENVNQSEKVEPMQIDTRNEENATLIVEEQSTQEPQIYYLDEEKQALLFNQAGAQAMPQVEIPDDFFDLTVKDIRLLHIDMQRLNDRLKESPLMTEKLRNLEKEKNVLTTIHKYTKAVIRIYFPNQLVLQGIFRPLESVQAIKDFVKAYLEHPQTDFALYTTPPRYNLDSGKSLLDENLVPSAKIYYSGSSDLKPEIKSKMTDASAASYAATKIRLKTMRNDDALFDDSAGPSNTPERHQPKPQKSSSDKIPKWFKPSKT
ncbi:tether containing UBX domain for GLUT4 [Copidosoma floridanum]|uniref:tether containing UBX domain for GLUT4 n=1 Tax=Copidosoma floridanum TaxID=29053 RepID=UPI0006C952D2|nr:tether containing UBX domain for GLUT4 [Copidosoma floridanum]XP_014206336.1 tether containing UBX domain for GLUT4 [Copidosoma floridanum]XP_014206337.1 tether containing UBX domain for GLUT4 [Copidosoma floridanum]